MTNNQRDELLISLSKGLNNLQCNFNDFRTEIKTEINQVETRLNKKFDGLTQEVSDLKVTVNQNTEKIDGLTQEVSDLKVTVKQNTERIDGLTQEVLDLKVTVNQNTERIDGLTQEVSDLKVTVKQNTERIDGLTQEVSDLKVTVNQNNDNLSKEIASVKKYAEENIKSIPDIFREIYKTNYEQSEYLKKHDIEIKDLQEKLA